MLYAQNPEVRASPIQQKGSINMKKLKRVFALLGAVFLAGMYVAVLILGLTASPHTQNLLMAAIACTIILPCLLYGMMLIARILDNRGKEDRNTDKKRGERK